MQDHHQSPHIECKPITDGSSLCGMHRGLIPGNREMKRFSYVRYSKLVRIRIGTNTPMKRGEQTLPGEGWVGPLYCEGEEYRLPA